MRSTLRFSGSVAICIFWTISCAQTSRPAGPDRPHLQVGGGTIYIHIEGQNDKLSQEDLDSWIQTAANAVTNYFGRFPIKQAELEITVGDPGKINGGVTYGGRRITIRLGRQTRLKDLQSDWRLTHEMFHLAFPDLPPDYIWMQEGLSTYLEPLARARIGNLRPEIMWSETVREMPQGLPEPGDQGLDRTHTWGRTYWGGAMFWLIADVRIREQTDTRASLDTAIRAILAAGGDGSARWSAARVFEIGDRATGTTVLRDLHNEMGLHGVAPDLKALWKRLGIVEKGNSVTFEDTAPLAKIRRSMTAPRTDE